MALGRSALSGETVLVTGSQGFTGRYLVEALQNAGAEVIGTGISLPEQSLPYRYFPMDFEDPQAIARVVDQVQPHRVVHLAALAFVGHQDAAAFYRVNLIGTRYLLEALHRQPEPPSQIVLASSANVYGNCVAPFINEQQPHSPQNDYAVSKSAMEQMAMLWQDRLPITLVRPFNYTGHGQSNRFLVAKIVEHFRRKAPKIELGNLDVSRDYTDVRDLVAAYMQLLAQNITGKTLNICSGEVWSLAELLDQCQRLTNHPIDVVVNPDFVRRHEIKRLCGDQTELNRIIGPDWRTYRMQDTLDWMLQAR